MSQLQSPSLSYVIVGAGVFGTSTAYHLIQRYPDASITLVDRDAVDAETRVAASWDWNKVVRADYADPEYCRLALEAKKIWSSDDPLWNTHYHQSGIYWITPEENGFVGKVVKNYERLGEMGEWDCEMIPLEEAKRGDKFGGLFKDAEYTGVKEVLVNRSSGWADAKGALRAVGERCVQLGVKYVTAEIERLEIDADGRCVGVRTSGDVIKGDKVVLCTGSYTPRLLADSAVATGIHDLSAGQRIISAGVTTGLAQLKGDIAEKFSQMPVGIQENPKERGASNGALPLTAEKQLKLWGQWIFSNTSDHSSGIQLSTPPSQPDYAQWDVPELLKEDIRLANKFMFGKEGSDLIFEKFRICWEALTPSEDFIISPHSASKGLYIATCGSFHGWKFFPILGKYIVEMLNGTLEPGLERKWAWDRKTLDGPSHIHWWPRHELSDIAAGKE